jgi:hypothetical protein
VHEVQLGDPAFDDVVFIDTAAEDAEVHRLFRSESVRRAARTLIERGAHDVLVDGEAVTTSFSLRSFSPVRDVFDAFLLVDVLEATLELRSAGPVQGRARPRPGEALSRRLVVLVIPACAAALWSLWTYRMAPLLTVIGVVVGLGVGLALQAYIQRTVRGASNSRTVAHRLRVLVALLSLSTAVGALRLSNVAFDRSPGTEVAGRVSAPTGSRFGNTQSKLVLANGIEAFVDSSDVRGMDHVQVKVFPGAFGFWWTALGDLEPRP